MTKNYLRTFLSRCDVYVHIDSTKATEFGQPCFSKFAFSLKIGYNSIVINGVTILHLIRFISERNKWFYTECDWSIQLYFSSYQQRRVFLSFGWFVTKVSFYHGSCVSHGGEAQGLLPRVTRQSETFCAYLCPSKQSSSKARLRQHQ